MNALDFLSIEEVMTKIDEVQEGQDLSCKCKECYWNMWSPKRNSGNDSMVCVSESLGDFKMTPNTEGCKGYWSYKEACGVEKEKA